MASQKQIINMITAIKALYPYYSKDGDAELVFNLWQGLFKDYDDDVIQPAFKMALQYCKMPPTPADVFEAMNTIAKLNAPSAQEMWDVLNKAIEDTDRYKQQLRYESNQTVRERIFGKMSNVWEELPRSLKDYVGSASELRSLADTDLSYYKSRFMREYKPAADARYLPEKNKKLTE